MRDISQPADMKLKVNSLEWLERKDDTHAEHMMGVETMITS